MEDWRHKEARKRVKKIKGFYSHLASYIIMGLFFIGLNLFTSPDFFWAFFPIAGWGIGIAFHAIDVFGFPGIGRDWEQRQLEKEMNRLQEAEDAKRWKEYQKSERYLQAAPEDSETLDLEDKPVRLKELRKDWNDSDFV